MRTAGVTRAVLTREIAAVIGSWSAILRTQLCPLDVSPQEHAILVVGLALTRIVGVMRSVSPEAIAVVTFRTSANFQSCLSTLQPPLQPPHWCSH